MNVTMGYEFEVVTNRSLLYILHKLSVTGVLCWIFMLFCFFSISCFQVIYPAYVRYLQMDHPETYDHYFGNNHRLSGEYGHD